MCNRIYFIDKPIDQLVDKLQRQHGSFPHSRQHSAEKRRPKPLSPPKLGCWAWSGPRIWTLGRWLFTILSNKNSSSGCILMCLPQCSAVFSKNDSSRSNSLLGFIRFVACAAGVGSICSSISTPVVFSKRTLPLRIL